jgi:hypothetical protein
MKKKLLLFAAFIVIIISHDAYSKKPVTVADYDHWKNLKNTHISENGQWVSYEINPQIGDGWLYIYEVATQKLDSFPRGYNAKLSPNSNYITFKIKPAYKETREAKLKKLKKDKMPKDTLGIYVFESKNFEKIIRIKSFRLAKEKSDWMAYTFTEKIKKDTSKTKKDIKKKMYIRIAT